MAGPEFNVWPYKALFRYRNPIRSYPSSEDCLMLDPCDTDAQAYCSHALFPFNYCLALKQ